MSIRTRLVAFAGALALLAGSAVLVNAAPASATVVSVTVTSSADTAGTCPSASNCTLRQALTDANQAGINDGADASITIAPGLGTITLVNELFYDGGSNDFSLTINGNGATLLGTGSFRLLSLLTNGSTTISGLTFSEGHTGSGGAAIYAIGPLTIDSSSFDHNSAVAPGGAIYASQVLELTNVAFSANASNGVGGAVYSTSQLTATDVSFSENMSVGSGGGLYAGDDADLTRTTFANNISYGDGAAINAYQGLYISSSTFNANDASDHGGAIYASTTVNVSDSTFSHNNAGQYGGALYAQGGGASITDTSFVSNTSSHLGGAVYSTTSSTLNGVVFDANHAGDDGGAIWADAFPTSIADASFTSNSADHAVGALMLYGPTSISDALFSHNSATGANADVGAIYSLDNIDITSSIIEYNHADRDVGGLRSDGNINLTHSSVRYNTSGGYIGGISGDNVTISDSTVNNNTAVYSAGGIGTDGDLHIANSTIAENLSTNGPGAIKAPHAVDITNSTITANAGGGTASTIFARTLTLTSSTISAVPTSAGNFGIEALTSISSFGTVFTGEPGSFNGSMCNITATSLGYNYATDTSCGLTGTGDTEGASITTPVLGALADHGGETFTQLPLVSRPLVGAIPNSACMSAPNAQSSDQRGFARPTITGGPCDIGAVQLSPQSSAIVSGSTVTVTVSEFTSLVTVTLHSDPIVLGTIAVDATGSGTGTFDLPCAAGLGDHTIISTSADGQSSPAPIYVGTCVPEVVPVYAG